MLFLSGCSEQRVSYLYGHNESSGETLEFETRGFVNPVIADLNIPTDRVYVTLTVENTLTSEEVEDFKRDNKKNSETEIQTKDLPSVINLKTKARSEFYARTKCDIIVAPVYDIKTSEDFTTMTVTLSGFPATYKSFRNMTQEEHKLYILNYVGYPLPAVEADKKKK